MTEQEPNRRLSVLNSERRTGIPEHKDMPEALRRTWLAGLPEPWTFELAAGYTLTHVVFHLTDWGLTPQAVPPPVADYLRQWLPPWLDTCLEDEQWDLSCELLAVASSLPGPPQRALLQDAWARLAVAQDDSGAVPEVGARGGGRTTAHDFIGRYHSTLMTVFAAVLTINRLQEPAVDGAAADAAGALKPVPHPGDGGQGVAR